MKHRSRLHLWVGLLACGLLLDAMGCSATPAPAAQTPAVVELPSPTPMVAIPSATAVFLPVEVTLTPTSTPAALPTSQVIKDEADRLVAAAIKFQAETPEEVEAVLSRLGEANAGNIDGPLALAILKQAGRLGPEVKTHRFWLLDPLIDAAPLQNIFPREDFEWRLFLGALRELDFLDHGLLPGELLYLIPINPKRAGKFLLVTRVDLAGRAFSTTNLADPKSGAYRIAETLLFDPKNPAVGLLADATSLNKGAILVRKRSYAGMNPGQEALNRVLNQGGVWQVVVQPVGDEILFSRAADEVIHPASVIKLPLAMLVMKYLTAGEVDLDRALASAPPEAGRTYEQLLHAMLVLSEETATDILEKDANARLGTQVIRTTLDAWGAKNTTLEPRRSTAREIAHLWEGLDDESLLGRPASQILLGYLGEKTAGDSVRLWKMVELLPVGARIYNKRGSLTRPVIVADSGIVVLPNGKAYVLCLFGKPDEWTNFEELDAIIAEFGVTWVQQYIR